MLFNKSIPSFIAVFAICIFIFNSSCKKSETTTATPTVVSSVTAKVNGADFNSNTDFMTVVGASLVSFGGITSTGKTISLSVPYGTGSYPITSATTNVNASYSEGSNSWTTFSNTGNGGSGNIVVTAITPNSIKGTFSFVAKANSGTATGDKTVSAGTFNITQ